MTDIELLKKIKNENSIECRDALWNRYQGKIYNTYFKSKSFYNLVDVSIEEFVQESWIAFCDALDYVNIQKMEDSGSELFATHFYFFLLKIKNKFQGELYRYGVPILTSEIFFNPNSDSNHDELSVSTSLAIEFNEKTSCNLEDEAKVYSARKIIYEYVDHLQGSEKEIIELYLENKKISEISRALKLKYTEVYQFIGRVKKDLETIYLKNAIA